LSYNLIFAWPIVTLTLTSCHKLPHHLHVLQRTCIHLRGQSPIPPFSVHPPSLSHCLPSPPFLFRPFSSHPLRLSPFHSAPAAAPLYPAKGLGIAVTPPVGAGAEPPPQTQFRYVYCEPVECVW